MNVPHGGLQVLVTSNSRYIHYIGIRCVDTLGDSGMTQTMRRRMVNISAYYRCLKHLSNILNTSSEVTGFGMGKCRWGLRKVLITDLLGVALVFIIKIPATRGSILRR